MFDGHNSADMALVIILRRLTDANLKTSMQVVGTFGTDGCNWVVIGKSALRVRRAESCLSATGPFRPSALLATPAPQSMRGASHSYFRSFSQGESVVDVHSKVADRVLNFAVPQQYLHST